MNILNLQLLFEIVRKNESNKIPQNSKGNIQDGVSLFVNFARSDDLYHSCFVGLFFAFRNIVR